MESTEESYRTGQHFNSTLSFRKINLRTRSATHGILGNQNRKNVRQHQTKLKFDKVTLPSRHRPLFVRHYRAKYFPTQPLKMCSIILLKCEKLDGYNHVYF